MNEPSALDFFFPRPQPSQVVNVSGPRLPSNDPELRQIWDEETAYVQEVIAEFRD